MRGEGGYGFHSRCGQRISLSDDARVARRALSDFNCGLVFSAQPLVPGRPFTVRIDHKVSTWSGSIEVGATALAPEALSELPASATDLAESTWIMTGGSVLKDGRSLVELYGTDLDSLQEGDAVGILLTPEGQLEFLINGQSQGVAATQLPQTLYAVVDIYGKCVQVSVVQPSDRPPTIVARPDRLRFHHKCGHLIKLSNGQRTAERRRPLDEFNNGVVVTNRPLINNELFEIRIEKLVAKWSGSIEVGVTSHDPETLSLPATMTNLRSGTTMMSGCGILTNGQGTRREYGHFNLDELREGDTIGIVRKSSLALHYLINGLDQGVAVHHLPGPLWGVVDLYGMTVRVSILDSGDELPDAAPSEETSAAIVEEEALRGYESLLTFHRRCGSNAAVINGGRTAHRPNALEDFNNGVVLTGRCLLTGELFEVRLEQMVKKWAGSIELGVTTHRPHELDFPSTMTNVRSGTWMMTGNGVMHNGTTIHDDYGHNLDRLGVGDRVGVMRLADGTLHFYVNGTDQGVAATGVPEAVHGVIDLYGQASRASIVSRLPAALGTLESAPAATPLRFHHVHGKNACVSASGRTATRPRAYGEFNDAIVITTRPLGDDELFEVLVEQTVDRWSGSIEVGVTKIRPDELDFPSTMTDIDHDSWMLSGSSVMQNGTTIKNGYRCDLDLVRTGCRIGVVRHASGDLHFYLNGEDQGVACENVPPGVFAVIDLYGQCSQVTITSPRDAELEESLVATPHHCHSPAKTAPPPPLKHQFSSKCSPNLTLRNNNLQAVRTKNSNAHALVFSAKPLEPDSTFEVCVGAESSWSAGCIGMGVTALDVDAVEAVPAGGPAELPADTWFLSGSQVRRNKEVLRHLFCPNLQWLQPGDRLGLRLTHDGTLRALVNNEDVGEMADNLPRRVFAVFDVFGRTESISVMQETGGVVGVRGGGEDARFLSPDWLQDSLEAGGGAMHTSSTLSSPMQPEPTSPPEAAPRALAFHERHGRNIKLSNSRATAQRIASYNQGLVLGAHPLAPDLLFQFKVDRVSCKWTSSVLCGVTSQHPDTLTVPVTALALRKDTWIIASDGVFYNGDKIAEYCGNDWSELQAGQVVGLMVSGRGQLHLFLNHKDQGVVASNVATPCYPVVDVYGQCEQVTILEYNSVCVWLPDKEKAEYEAGEEKEDSLRFIDQSISDDSILVQSIILSRAASCDYLELCTNFLHHLGLPEGFFMDGVGGVCFCGACLVGSEADKDGLVQRQGDPEREFWLPRGWCCFELRRPGGAEAQLQWHTAFCPLPAPVLRRCLDAKTLVPGRGQRALKEKTNSACITLHPDINTATDNSSHRIFCEPLSCRKWKSQVGVEVLVRPGSYQVSGCDSGQRWSTKEHNNLTLRALLLRLEPLHL